MGVPEVLSGGEPLEQRGSYPTAQFFAVCRDLIGDGNYVALSPSRTIRSPGTDNALRLPVGQRFESACFVLGDVEGGDDVVDDRPPPPGCLGVIEAVAADHPYGRHRYGAERGQRHRRRHRATTARHVVRPGSGT